MNNIYLPFLLVTLIWSTTPLTIQWSGQGVGFLFGVSMRMVIGVVFCLLLMKLFGRHFRTDKRALLTYVAAGLALWIAMSSVYWGAQHVSSGLVSVLFGLTPIVTGLFAVFMLNEKVFTPFRVVGMLLGVAGLVVIYGDSATNSATSIAGIAAVLFAVVIHSVSAVWIKRIAGDVDGLVTTTGSLILSVPLFLLTWLLFDGTWPVEIASRTMWSIVYLGIFGSAIGFVLYYHVLRHWSAAKVALITLMTPVFALLLGVMLNNEVITLQIALGSVAILLALASYLYGDSLVAES